MTAANIKKFANGSNKSPETTTTAQTTPPAENAAESPVKTGANTNENIWLLAIYTIYDVVFFLGASIYYILQVKFMFNFSIGTTLI